MVELKAILKICYPYCFYGGLLLVLVGLIFLPRLKFAYLQGLVLVCASLIACAVMLEALLLLGLMDSNHVWIPRKYLEETWAINDRNASFSSHNQHKFNDLPRDKHKEPGAFRIAVLGDSFVWGDGLPREEIWSIKLAKKIETKYPNTEVLNWGHCGWGTLEQFDFLKSDGKDYGLDLLIMAFVANDPDLPSSIPRVALQWQRTTLLDPPRFLVPELVSFLTSFINRNIEAHSTVYGYDNWSNNLYRPDNLARYSELLFELAGYCKKNDIPLLYVLTPTNHTQIYKEKFNKVKPIMHKAGIKYLDLYPALYTKLSHLSRHEVKAHRANSHPGPKITTVFAEEVFSYLEENSYLPALN